MDSKILAVIAAAIIVVAGIGVYLLLDGGDDESNGSDDDGPVSDGYVIDAIGREVAIPGSMDNGIVTIGSTGPLRFLSMFDVYDSIIEVDKGDITDNRNGRAYSYAYDYFTLDVETQSHPDNALDSSTVESIVNKNPSLVVTTATVYNNYSENFDLLANYCCLVVLMDQQMKYMTEDGGLADYLEFNIDILGKVLNKEDRAEELKAGIMGIVGDLASLSGESATRVYVAGVTISGSNSLNTTFPTYLPFVLTGVTNAYDGGSTENKVVLDIEDFTQMDIDVIIIDPSSSDKIADNQDSQNVMNYIYRLNTDDDETNDIRMYVTVPIVWDSINYDCALASAYFVVQVVYGTLTPAETVEKISAVFTLFYGENGANVLEDMTEFFVDKSSANGQEMPLLGEVVIVKNGDSYSFVAA